MPIDTMMLLASFGAERAWELVMWLAERRRHGAPSWEAKVVAAVADQYPDLLTRAESRQLQSWLHATPWQDLLASSDQSQAAPVLDSLAAVLDPGGNRPGTSGDTAPRTRAAAVLGATWQAMLTQLDRTDLLILAADAQRRREHELTWQLLARIRDDHAEIAGRGLQTLTSLEEIHQALSRLVPDARASWPALDPGKVPLRDAAIAAPSRLLRPRHAVIPLLFREEQRDRLVSWTREQEQVSVAVVTGAAGTGKTRLAAELCDHLARETPAKWRAGFLAAQSAHPAGTPAFHASDSLCIVVDYAEARNSEVIEMLAAALHAPPRRLCVLLLMRNPASPQDPLNRLRFTRDEIDEVLEHSLVMELRRASWDRSQRAQFAATAAAEFAAARRQHDAATAAEPEGETPLELSIQALLGVLDGPEARGDRYGSGALEALLRHEERYWLSTAAGAGLQLNSQLLRRCVALVALASEAIRDDNELADALQLVPDFGGAPPSQLHEVARWLRWTYPSDVEGSYVSAIQPDLLAEQLVATVGIA